MRIVRQLKWLIIIGLSLTVLTYIYSTTEPAKESHDVWFPHNNIIALERPMNVTLPTPPAPAISSLIHTFSSLQDEILYLYQKHVLGNWKPDVKKVQQLRREMFMISNATTIDQFILTQKNTHSEDSIPLYSHGVAETLYLKPTESLLKHLPKDPVFPNGTVFDKCSVVGNSGILHRSNCGKEIDSADYVFRCNLVPIKKFGVDAGFKTNVTTMNPSVIVDRYKGFKLKSEESRFGAALKEYTGHLFLPCLIDKDTTNRCMLKIVPAIKRQVKKTGDLQLSVVVGNSRHLMGIVKFWKPSGVHYLSTGFYLAQTAITLCNEVHLYGFWPFSRSPYPIAKNYTYHFFDSRAQSVKHKFNVEFQILWQQHKEGIVKLHTTDCD